MVARGTELHEESEWTRLWRQFGPWAVAGCFASGFVILWALVLPWPLRIPGRAPSRIVCPFPPLESLSDSACAAVQRAGVFYWPLGLLWSWRAFLGAGATRASFARALVTGATGALVFVIPLLAVIWTLAAQMGVIPDGPWGVSEGNHGPWRRVCDLRTLVNLALTLPGYSLLLARVSLFIRGSRAAWAVILGSLFVFMALISSHQWLID